MALPHRWGRFSIDLRVTSGHRPASADRRLPVPLGLEVVMPDPPPPPQPSSSSRSSGSSSSGKAKARPSKHGAKPTAAAAVRPEPPTVVMQMLGGLGRFELGPADRSSAANTTPSSFAFDTLCTFIALEAAHHCRLRHLPASWQPAEDAGEVPASASAPLLRVAFDVEMALVPGLFAPFLMTSRGQSPQFARRALRALVYLRCDWVRGGGGVCGGSSGGDGMGGGAAAPGGETKGDNGDGGGGGGEGGSEGGGESGGERGGERGGLVPTLPSLLLPKPASYTMQGLYSDVHSVTHAAQARRRKGGRGVGARVGGEGGSIPSSSSVSSSFSSSSSSSSSPPSAPPVVRSKKKARIETSGTDVEGSGMGSGEDNAGGNFRVGVMRCADSSPTDPRHTTGTRTVGKIGGDVGGNFSRVAEDSLRHIAGMLSAHHLSAWRSSCREVHRVLALFVPGIRLQVRRLVEDRAFTLFYSLQYLSTSI